jgi:2-dehydro-3-deoxyphosphogalactonate aldolase
VIAATVAAGMQTFPGVFTATECFAALKAGATGLKIFPALQMGPEGLAALRAVLPKAAPVYAVGGVGPENFAAWRRAGADGFGIGTALYKPGRSAAEVAARAAEMVAAWDGVLRA